MLYWDMFVCRGGLLWPVSLPQHVAGTCLHGGPPLASEVFLSGSPHSRDTGLKGLQPRVGGRVVVPSHSADLIFWAEDVVVIVLRLGFLVVLFKVFFSEKLRQGSNCLVTPGFHSSSALSFPGMPHWEGTHWSVILSNLLSQLSLSSLP